MPLWLTTTYRRSDFPGCITQNRWRSVEAHFHDGEGWVLQSVLPMKAAKNSSMTDYNLSEVWFPRTHVQKSLTRRWRSYCHGCIHNNQSFNLAQSIIHTVLGAFLAFSFTFFLITTLFINNTWIYIIIICKVPCLSLNARHQLQDRSICCSCLQNECSLHYHTTESGLTFIGQHIWIKLGIMLGILIIQSFQQRIAVCECADRAGKLTIWEGWAPEVVPVGAGGVKGRGGGGSGVRSLRRSGGGAPVLLCLQWVCRFFVVPFSQGRQPDIWFQRSIAGCLCIAAFTFWWPRNSTPHFISSRSSAGGSWMRYFVSSNGAREKPSLAILAILKARRMSDSSSCTRPPSLAIVADMLNTYKTLDAASNNEIWLLPLPYTLP